MYLQTLHKHCLYCVCFKTNEFSARSHKKNAWFQTKRSKVVLAFTFCLLCWLWPKSISAKDIAVCSMQADFTSIQSAINAAQPGDRIIICAATYPENLVITKDLTLQGEGAFATIIDGGQVATVLKVGSTATVTVTNLALTNGLGNGNDWVDSSAVNGGGVFNQGNLLLLNIIISNNATGNNGDGGGIWNGGKLRLFNSTVNANSAGDDGGGVYNTFQMTITNSTISSNTARNDGGGIYHGGDITATQLVISQCTIVKNSANSAIYPMRGGGAIYNYQGNVEIGQTVLADSFSGTECAGISIVSRGQNIASDNSCNLRGDGDMAVTNPNLGPLTEIETEGERRILAHPPLANSPVIDKIPANLCKDVTDQRGILRPQGSWCDIGAIEAEISVHRIVFVSSSSGGTVDQVNFADEDILAFDRRTHKWIKYFDGSDVGLQDSDVDAFALLNDGALLLSLKMTTTLPGLGVVAPADVIRFNPTSLGLNSAGNFEWYLDGSDVGLDTASEDVDALGISTGGNTVMSMRGAFAAQGISGNDEDLLALREAQWGSNSAGVWNSYFQGNRVGLEQASEDIKDIWIDPDNNDIYFVTSGAFTLDGYDGDNTEILICHPIGLGPTTGCTFTIFWDGAAHGFGAEVTDALDIGEISQIINVVSSGEEPPDGANNETSEDFDVDEEIIHRLLLPLIRRR